MRFLLFIVLITASSCTANLNSGDPTMRESEIVDRMDRAGSRFAWYCGSEGVSVRSLVRVSATVVFTIASLGDIPDLCRGYNLARAEAIQQIQAEREALESGLLDLQEGTVNE